MVAMSISSTQTVVRIYHLPLKGIGAFGKLDDSRSGDKASYSAGNKGATEY